EIKTLTDEKDKLNKEIDTLKRTNESLDSQLNTTLKLLEINFDVKISIEQKMNVTVEGVTAFTKIAKP
ncbi:14086_t:CDS:1, partial [Racocetra fulgida]